MCIRDRAERGDQGEERPDAHRGVRVADQAGDDEGQREEPGPRQVGAEGGRAVGAGGVALGRHDEPGAAPQQGLAQRAGVQRCRERGHHHAGGPGGAGGFVGADVVAPVPDVEPDLEGRRVAVEHQPQRGLDGDARRPEPEEERAGQGAQQPVERGHGVVGHHEAVVEEPAGREGPHRAPELAQQRLVGPARPAQLLAEEVRPGRGALADGEDVGGVDGLPAPAGGGVAAAVDLQAGRHVLGDRVVEAADLPQDVDPYAVAGADEHGRAVGVAGALDEGVEEELLALGGLGDGRGVVAVDLGADDERDVGVAEVAHHALEEVGQRDVVGVHAGHERVGVAVGVEPGVVVAVLGAGAVDAGGLVPAVDALAGEVAYAQPFAEPLGLGVVALVQQPDVQRPVVLDADGPLERGPHHGQRFLAGHEGGQERDAGAGLGADGHRVPGHPGGVGVGGDVDHAEQLDQPDGDQHDGVGAALPVADVGPVEPVLGRHEPQQEGQGDQGGRRHEQHHPDAAAGAPVEQAAVAHAVRADGGFGQLPGESAEAGVVVALRAARRAGRRRGGTARGRCAPSPAARCARAGYRPRRPGRPGRTRRARRNSHHTPPAA